MKAFAKSLAGRSRRSKIWLALAGALLVIVVAAGAVLTGNPLLAARLAHSMTGATQQATDGSGPIKLGNKCLTVTTEWLWEAGKFQVRLWECDPSNPGTQQWRYMTDRLSYIIGHDWLGDEVCLDVEGASTANGGTITTFRCRRGAPNLDWNILGLGFLDQVEGRGIKFQNENSKMCMELADNSTHPYMLQRPCDEVRALWVWPPDYVPQPNP